MSSENVFSIQTLGNITFKVVVPIKTHRRSHDITFHSFSDDLMQKTVAVRGIFRIAAAPLSNTSFIFLFGLHFIVGFKGTISMLDGIEH